MKRSAITILSILILLAAGGITHLLIKSRKPPEKIAIERTIPVVEVLVVRPADTPIEIPSQGLVEPWRETKLAAEVGGRVRAVSPKLEAGSDVAEGETLVELDTADLLAALESARARLAEAELALANEEAAAAQAKRDWERLGLGGEPTPLSLREPQLASARAGLAAAQAAVAKSELDVRRATIRAPFAGRVRAKLVETGMVVSPGTPVAEMFSTEGYKIRLSVPIDDAVRVQRNDGKAPAVRFFTSAGGRRAEWKGEVVRTEGNVDRTSRSLQFVGSIPSSNMTSDTGIPLLPGLFVDAAIEGRVLEKVTRLPRVALLDDRRVLIVDKENKLRFRDVEIAWSDRKDIYVSGGLEPDERVCITTVESVIDGETLVQPANEKPEKQPPPPDQPAPVAVTPN
ncbi:MAG: efflux RND transporter periplasmic adaptor subunit [Verrucomicrobiales bacterium]